MAKVGEELIRFVRESLARGMSRDQIRVTLVDAGWRSEQVNDALHSFAETDFPVPVPMPRTNASAKEAFLYLVAFSTLYVSAYSLGALAFEIIDYFFLDPIREIEWSEDTIKWSIARLIIAFPVYVYATYRIRSFITRDPLNRESSVRRWLTYMAMFIAVIVVICDLVFLVISFLSGTLTLPFLLKVVATATVAGSILSYYFWELGLDERNVSLREPFTRTAFAVCTAIVLAAVVGGQIIIGSPSDQRLRRLDDKRVSDLRTIEIAIDGFQRQQGRLPENLDELAEDFETRDKQTDPETGEPYGYRVLGENSYELCANFSLSSDERYSHRPYSAKRSRTIPFFISWRHDKGRKCFQRKVQDFQKKNP